MKHSLLLTVQVKIIAVLFAFLSVVGIATASIQLVQHHDHRRATATAEARSHFWKVVAGVEQPNAATVDNTLAQDLHDRLGPSTVVGDPNSFNRISQRIEDFRGNSNEYGGITDAIGYDPFADETLPCKECGPLDARTIHNLLLIQQGNLKVVLAKDVPHYSDKYKFTPFGVGVLPVAVLAWFIGGPITLAAAHQRLMGLSRAEKVHDYDIRQFSDLSWSLNGDHDGTKLALMALSPSFFLPFTVWRAANKRRFEKKVCAAYPSEMAMVQDIDRVLARVSLRHGDNPKIQALQHARETLVDEIQSLTRSSDQQSVDALVARTEQKLKDVEQSLQDRQDARAELAASDPTVSQNVLPQPKTRKR